MAGGNAAQDAGAVGDPGLTTAHRMLADPLDYQRTAVRQALDPDKLRPRILIADAVGLGKTLEIGMILSELVRRGRGERILVVTPKHVLEQMQHELWRRFALPFVRLDSTGIQTVRQKLPATRNPFTYFKRAIISIDTLKSARYNAHLRSSSWDAVVIDESHNLTNAGTQNNELARLLAPNTEALILASATPHNGKAESFAELLRLLDPTAVHADGELDQERRRALLIRRHRHSPDVAAEVGTDWAERAEPRNLLVAAVTRRGRGRRRARRRPGCTPSRAPRRTPATATALFPWTLAKAFLSSPGRARASRSSERRAKLDPTRPRAARELAALERARRPHRRRRSTSSRPSSPRSSSTCKEIGVGHGIGDAGRRLRRAGRDAATGCATRCRKALGLDRRATSRCCTAASPTSSSRSIVDGFKLATSPIRVLVTGDVASEGVNLHAQCHHLIHYDIPWSLIRIEQRNGRIDRYGQKHPPEIPSLILEPSDAREFSGDLRVLATLLERENQAHTTLGDVGLADGQAQRRGRGRTRSATCSPGKRRSTTSSAPPTRSPPATTSTRSSPSSTPTTDRDDDWTPAAADAAPEPVPRRPDFLDEALHAAFHDNPARRSPSRAASAGRSAPRTASPNSPRRAICGSGSAQLPQNYLQHGRVMEKLKLATNTAVGNAQLRAAREGKGVNDTTWPEAHYLGPLHPVLDWASDRALTALGRNQVFVIRGDVDAPTVLLMGTLTNKRGQLISRVFSTAVFPNPANTDFCLVEPLEDIGFLDRSTALRPGSRTPARSPTPSATRPSSRSPSSTPAARCAGARRAGAATTERLAGWRQRAQRWHADADS